MYMKDGINPAAVYSSKEAARLLNMHPYTFHGLVRKGEIKAKRLSKGYRVLGEELLNYISK